MAFGRNKFKSRKYARKRRFHRKKYNKRRSSTKNVVSRKYLKGVHRKYVKGTELKWTASNFLAAQSFPTFGNMQAVFNTNGFQTGTVPWLTPPTSGVSQLQYIGTKFNLKGFWVSFVAHYAVPLVATQPYDIFRVAVLKCIKPITQYGAALPPLPIIMTECIDPKEYTIYYDKYYSTNPGIVNTVTIGGQAYSVNAGAQWSAKVFKFWIPYKMTTELQLNNFLLPNPIIIAFQNLSGQIVTDTWYVKTLFKDP